MYGPCRDAPPEGCSPSTRAVSLALVGCGRAGTIHLRSIAQLPAVRLAYIIDTDEAKAAAWARLHGCAWSTSIRTALDDAAVDGVIIASVTSSHYGYCKAALVAGKAVFTEKPISHEPAELVEVLELARGARAPFVVGFQRRHDANFAELKRRVDAGAVGAPRLIKCCSRDSPVPPLAYLAVSGGIFHDMLVHDFDMLHFLSGGQQPAEVHALGHCHDGAIAALDDLDTVAVSLKYATGLLALVDCSRCASYGYDQRVEVFGERGVAAAHNAPVHTVVVGDGGGFHSAPLQPSFPERYATAYADSLRHFVQLARTGARESAEATARHAALEHVVAAAELSWRLGEAVKLRADGTATWAGRDGAACMRQRLAELRRLGAERVSAQACSTLS